MTSQNLASPKLSTAALTAIALSLAACASKPIASAVDPQVSVANAAVAAAPTRLAGDDSTKFLRLQAAGTGIANAGDDGRNTFLAFNANVPVDLAVFDQDGRPLRFTVARTVAAVPGVHKGILLRVAASSSYLAPNPRASTAPLASMTSDPDVLQARSQLEGEDSQVPAFQRALERATRRSEVSAPAQSPSTPVSAEVRSTTDDPTYQALPNGAIMRIFFASGGRTIVRPDDGLVRLESEARKASRIRITGFTDNQGSVSTNNALAQRRAEAVRQQLVARGIPAERIFVAWTGAADFIAENATDQGRAMNRRVEVQLLQSPLARK